MSDPSSIAYWDAPAENPNFQSRPPDPGLVNYYTTLGKDALIHSPVGALARMGALHDASEKYTQGPRNDDQEQDISTPVPKATLDVQTANKKYGIPNELHFDEPITDDAAALLHQRAQSRIDRDYLIQSGNNSGFRATSGMGMSMAASILDPINLASMFIPVVGEANIDRIATQFGSKAMQRLVQGGLTGMSAQATLEPLIYGANHMDHESYSLQDSAKNLGFGLLFGGLLHAGLGAIADHIRSLKPAESSQIFETAMNDVLNDRPVLNPGKVAEFAERETIKSPATRFEGEVHEGVDHPTIAQNIVDQSEGKHYLNDVLERGETGFTTSNDRFVGREEAYQVARDSGQVKRSPLEGTESQPLLGANDTSAPGLHPLNTDEKLQALDTQTRSEQVEDTRVQKVNEMTRTESPRDTQINPRERMDVPKDTQRIIKEAEDLKEQMFPAGQRDFTISTGDGKETPHETEMIRKWKEDIAAEQEKQKTLDDQIKAEVGDQEGRQAAIKAAVNCITGRMI